MVACFGERHTWQSSSGLRGPGRQDSQDHWRKCPSGPRLLPGHQFLAECISPPAYPQISPGLRPCDQASRYSPFRLSTTRRHRPPAHPKKSISSPQPLRHGTVKHPEGRISAGFVVLSKSSMNTSEFNTSCLQSMHINSSSTIGGPPLRGSCRSSPKGWAYSMAMSISREI